MISNASHTTAPTLTGLGASSLLYNPSEDHTVPVS